MKSKMSSIIVLLAVFMLVGMFAGCSNPRPTATVAPKTSADASKKVINLSFWSGVAPENGPKAVVDAWNAKNPDIQVQYVRYVNDDAGNLKLDTAMLTGQDVDIFVNYGGVQRVQKRVDANMALDLSVFKDYNIEDKMGPDAKGWLVNGKYYTLPTTRAHFSVWLNKDALDQAGLPVPTDWTWDDMKMYTAKLKTDKRFGLLQHLEPYPDSMDSVLTKEGYVKADGTSNLNSPLIGKWLQTLNGMMKDGSTPPLGEQLSTKLPADTTFLKGGAAMLNAGEWIFTPANNLTANPRTFKIAFAPVPRLSSDPKGYKIRGGLGDAISINAKSPNKDAAWKFLKWYADGGLLPMVRGGRFPASKDVNQDEVMKLLLAGTENTYDLESFKRVHFGKFDTFTRNVPQQVMDIRSQEYEKYFLGSQSLDETLAAMVNRHNDFLNQNK